MIQIAASEIRSVLRDIPFTSLNYTQKRNAVIRILRRRGDSNSSDYADKLIRNIPNVNWEILTNL